MKRAKTFQRHRANKDNVVHSICIPRVLFEELEQIAVSKNMSRNSLVNFAIHDFLANKENFKVLTELFSRKELKQLLALNFHEKINYLKGK